MIRILLKKWKGKEENANECNRERVRAGFPQKDWTHILSIQKLGKKSVTCLVAKYIKPKCI